jgi:hypothetical protein
MGENGGRTAAAAGVAVTIAFALEKRWRGETERRETRKKVLRLA